MLDRDIENDLPATHVFRSSTYLTRFYSNPTKAIRQSRQQVSGLCRPLTLLLYQGCRALNREPDLEVAVQHPKGRKSLHSAPASGRRTWRDGRKAACRHFGLAILDRAIAATRRLSLRLFHGYSNDWIIAFVTRRGICGAAVDEQRMCVGDEIAPPSLLLSKGVISQKVLTLTKIWLQGNPSKL